MSSAKVGMVLVASSARRHVQLLGVPHVVYESISAVAARVGRCAGGTPERLQVTAVTAACCVACGMIETYISCEWSRQRYWWCTRTASGEGWQLLDVWRLVWLEHLDSG
jgi:hypothetical protein